MKTFGTPIVRPVHTDRLFYDIKNRWTLSEETLREIDALERFQRIAAANAILNPLILR